jgi:hypothetical protein
MGKLYQNGTLLFKQQRYLQRDLAGKEPALFRLRGEHTDSEARAFILYDS